jgi:hypothetical protein
MNGIADLYRLAEVEAGKPSPMMVFPVGDWTSAKYPRLSLSQELADEVIANFTADVLRTRVPVDLNHDPKSPANGWVERLYMAPFEWNGVSGEALFADWTPNDRGAQHVNSGEYAYDSLEIAAHEDPVTGTQYDNVLKAISLTNRPVLRMMPGVLEAGDAVKLAEPVDLQLSEVTLADEEPDPMASLLSDLEAVLGKASDTLKGKPGVRAIRTYLQEARAKASAHKLTEDDGYPAETHPASSDGSSQPAKADEGQPVTLAEGDAATKGADPMKTVIEALQLSEGADEATVLAAVKGLIDGKASAELKLADVEKAKRAGEVEVELAEIEKLGNLTPGEKPEFLTLAEEKPDVYAARVAERKALPEGTKIQLGESGTSQGSATGDKTADVELAEKAKARAAKDGIGIGEAQKLTLSEDPDLAKRIHNERYGKEA